MTAKSALKFSVGDEVIYTNDQGVSFRRKVTGFYTGWLSPRGYRYLLNTDCHWMPVKEANLAKA